MGDLVLGVLGAVSVGVEIEPSITNSAEGEVDIGQTMRDVLLNAH
jgi:hypothetical protein